jgi:hypothetical protein
MRFRALALAVVVFLGWLPLTPGRSVLASPADPGLRVAVGLGVSGGWASLAQFHDGVETYLGQISNGSPPLQLEQAPLSHRVYGAAVSARAYLPHHLLAELGLCFLWQEVSTGVTGGPLHGDLGYTNLVLELPLLVGGAYRPWSPLVVVGAAGPSVFLLSRSSWRYDLGRVSSFAAARGGGFHLLLGTEVELWRRAALGFELRYRYVRSGALDPTGPALPAPQPVTELDLSGVSLGLNLRIFVL